MPTADKINDLYSRLKQRSFQSRHQFERSWYGNVLAICGHQGPWVRYYDSTRRYSLAQDIKPWVPRCVTNKMGAGAQTIHQTLVAKPPATRVLPGTNRPEDVATALLADRYLDVIYDEARADDARKVLASWMVATGGGFLHPCYDPDRKGGETFVQHEMCSKCPGPKVLEPGMAPMGAPDPLSGQAGPVCPDCGSPMIPAMRANGKPIGESLPNGKTKLDVYSPFEVYYDLEARSMDDLDELFIRRRYPIDMIRDRYGSSIQPDASDGETGLGMTLLRAIAYAAGTGPVIGVGGDADRQSTVTVDYVWKRPCDEYPEGLVAVEVNGTLQNDGDTDIPYEDKNTGKKLWPWYYVPFDRIPGRMTGRTPLDDAYPLQTQRNMLESLILLIIQRSAAPHWIIPRGMGVDDITGTPAQIITYDAFEKNAKPEQIAGQNVPTSLIARLEKLDSDIEQMLGTFEVLSGNAPPGISAGTALRLLLERAVTRFTPALNNIEKAWEAATKDLLCIFQQYATEDREKRIAGPDNTWEIARFNGATLLGSLDVKVDAGSAIPKNTVGTQSLIQDLLGGGVINPQDPETQQAILEEFSMSRLLGSADLNVQQAQREAYDFFQGKPPMPPIVDPVIDNHMVHIIEHKKCGLKSDFKTLPPEVQMIWRQHIMEHEMAMAPAPAPTQPGKDAPAGKGKPSGDPNREPGMPGLPPSSLPADDTQQPGAFPGMVQ